MLEESNGGQQQDCSHDDEDDVCGLLTVLPADGLERREIIEILIDILGDAFDDVLDLVLRGHTR